MLNTAAGQMDTMHVTPAQQKDGGLYNGAIAVLNSSPKAASEQSTGSLVPLEVQEALLPRVVVRFQHPFSPWQRRYTVVLVSVMTAMLCADQNLLAPNLSEAAAFFGLNEQQKDTYLGGYLMAAFFIVGAPAALLCGYLADKYNRVLLLTSIVIIGETPCLCTYWVTELWQFFLVRMLTGIAVGGCFPLVFSLLGDLFPVSQRSATAAIVQIAVGAGIGGGQMLAGIVGPATNWRVPFVVMAAPSLLLAVLLVTTVREPPRGGFEEALAGQLAAGAAYSETITWHKIRRLLAVPSNWIIILQGLPGCLPWGVMQTYINDYLHINKGYSISMATVVILLFGIGCGVGVLAGGAAGQLLYNWRKESMALLTGLSVLAGAAPVYFLINANLQQAGFAATLFMSALAGALVSIAGPNVRAIMINVNTPETRGVSIALQSVTDDLGRGLGPVIVAGFISRLGRQGAFNISVAGWVPCGLILCCLVFTMRKDEARMQKQLADRSKAVLQQIQTSEGGALPPTSSSSEGGSSALAGIPATVDYTRNLPGSMAQHNIGERQTWPGCCNIRETDAPAAAAAAGSESPDTELSERRRNRMSDPGNSRRSVWDLQDSIHRLSERNDSAASTQQLLDNCAKAAIQGSVGPAAGLSASGARHRGSHRRSSGRNSSGDGSIPHTAPHSRAGAGGMPVAESCECHLQDIDCMGG